MRKLVLASLLAAGCATASSAGPAVRYAGEPFDLEQQGSRITGQVCGMDLTLDVAHRGPDAVELTGFVDGRFPVHLQARADGRVRTITGGLGSRAGDSAVALDVAPDKVDGRVGWRYFRLAAQGDALGGTMQIAGAIAPSDAVVDGRAQLVSMPLAPQAALLPALLSCNVQPVGRWGRSSLEVRVGGPPGALPHQSSGIYTRD